MDDEIMRVCDSIDSKLDRLDVDDRKEKIRRINELFDSMDRTFEDMRRRLDELIEIYEKRLKEKENNV